MRRLLLIAPLALSLLACGKDDTPSTPAADAGAAAAPVKALPPETQRALERYETQAREYLIALDGIAGPEELTAHSDELLSISEEVLPEFLNLRPHCREYLTAALTLKERWTALDVAAIESGYHKDGALPKIDNAADCYHMKDLIVHPITALALLAQSPDNRGKARHEIDEVLSHVSVVKATR